MNEIGQDVFFPESDRGIKAYAYHEGNGMKLELKRANGVFELPLEFVPYSLTASGTYSSLSALEQIEDMVVRVSSAVPKLKWACSAVSPTKEALFEPVVIYGSSGSRDVIYSIPGKWKVTKKDPSAPPSLDEWDRHLAAGHAEDRGWCPFCVAGKGKSEAHTRIETSCHHGHPELHLVSANIGREAEDRASPMLVGKFSKDRWSITHPVPCKGTQHRWIVGKLLSDVIMSGVLTLVGEELSGERIARCLKV